VFLEETNSDLQVKIILSPLFRKLTTKGTRRAFLIQCKNGKKIFGQKFPVVQDNSSTVPYEAFSNGLRPALELDFSTSRPFYYTK
jgi:hypothetical protein